MKSAVDWLTEHPTPKGSPERLHVIEELIYQLIGYGRGLRIASRSMKRWVSGLGDTAIPFDRLLRDRAFRKKYTEQAQKLMSECCSRASTSAKPVSGGFASLDLSFAFHSWDVLAAEGSFRSTGRYCWSPMGTGKERLGNVVFSFSDRYDWEPNEATTLPHTGIRIHQAWFIEYQTHAGKTHRLNKYGGPPRDFTTRSRQDEEWRLCCVAGRPHLLSRRIRHAKLKEGRAS